MAFNFALNSSLFSFNIFDRTITTLHTNEEIMRSVCHAASNAEMTLIKFDERILYACEPDQPPAKYTFEHLDAWISCISPDSAVWQQSTSSTSAHSTQTRPLSLSPSLAISTAFDVYRTNLLRSVARDINKWTRTIINRKTFAAHHTHTNQMQFNGICLCTKPISWETQLCRQLVWCR